MNQNTDCLDVKLIDLQSVMAMAKEMQWRTEILNTLKSNG